MHPNKEEELLDDATGLARRFLDACADIENTLKDRYSLNVNGFGAAVRESERRDVVVRRNRTALAVFTELRNVLSHKAYQGGEPVAAPLRTTVEAIESLRAEIIRPRPALDFAVRDVLTATESDPLPMLLQTMASRDISQVPVYRSDASVHLLTTNAIARWVAAHIDDDGSVLIDSGTTADALGYTESHESIRIERRTAPAAKVLDLLTREDPPGAVLLTENGLANESALGILSSTDVPRLVHELTVTAY